MPNVVTGDRHSRKHPRFADWVFAYQKAECVRIKDQFFGQFPWWRHQMKTFSASLAFCVGNSPVNDEFPSERPVKRSFDVIFDVRLNQLLGKKWRRRWFQALALIMTSLIAPSLEVHSDYLYHYHSHTISIISGHIPTHWGRSKVTALFQTTFPNASSWTNFDWNFIKLYSQGSN